MEQLVKLISEKAGITPEQSNVALNVVSGFLKEKMPAGMGSQVESFLKGGSGSISDIAGGLKDKIGGLLG
ncbi:MAG: DUF2267 domain-containing protein [Bacteroidia bacterium]|nr:DUF2267 domain-containing protein [Bacteroidia bacterium]